MHHQQAVMLFLGGEGGHSEEGWAGGGSDSYCQPSSEALASVPGKKLAKKEGDPLPALRPYLREREQTSPFPAEAPTAASGYSSSCLATATLLGIWVA